ncbi:ISL3 family transposase [Luteococcus sp. Sow4_B9]|uniref:ISL3 family transposase n=1 Tax=Luteococcus sp. Sow4_B9 TaxID=3438792 RepID=UPI003F9E9F23
MDEHVWHHKNPKTRGPKMLTGMVDFTPSDDGTARTRLLDLVPGRSGTMYADWLHARGTDWLDHIEVAALDPFRGYKNAIDDHLDDATAVLDAFHVVKLATKAVDEVRRRVQQATLGHRGRKGDPLFGIQTILRCSADNLSDKQKHRLATAIEAHEAHEEVFIAWQAAQRLRAVYHAESAAAGRAAAQQLLDALPTCPIPEIARLGRTLKQWRDAFLAYFDTGGASNGPTEAICESGGGWSGIGWSGWCWSC